MKERVSLKRNKKIRMLYFLGIFFVLFFVKKIDAQAEESWSFFKPELVYRSEGKYYSVNALGNTVPVDIRRDAEFYFSMSQLDIEFVAGSTLELYMLGEDNILNCYKIALSYPPKDGQYDNETRQLYVPLSSILKEQRGLFIIYPGAYKLANGQVIAESNMSSENAFYVNLLGEYMVKYNANGGSNTPLSQTKYHGITLSLSDMKPTREGYTFLGWSTNCSATSALYHAGGDYTLDGSATLYAVWKLNSYTVAYNANGGNGAPSPQTKTYGKTLTLSNTKPTRTGYTFLGWSASKTAASAAYKEGGNYTDNKGAILYAVWKKNQTSTSKPSDNSISTKKKKQTIKTSAASYTIYGSKGSCLFNVKRTGDGKLTYSSSNKKAAAVSSNGKITARSYGKTTITIKAAATKKYLAVSKKVTVTVAPKKAELKSVKSPAKGVIKFTWKRDRTVTGYEVYISPNKKFSQETKSKLFKQSIFSKKISKCPSKRNFYIKIRSYKTVGKTKYYGPWSEVKKVKVR